MIARKFYIGSSLLCAALLFPRYSLGAPGDQIGVVNVGPCNGVSGLSFDGKVLYATFRFDAAGPVIHRFDAKTGLPLSDIVVKQNGTPIPTGVGGLEWDSNRGDIWAGYADRVGRVSLATGEILSEVKTQGSLGAEEVTYDYWNDVVWEGDNNTNAVRGYCPIPKFGMYCGGHGLDGSPSGIAFDGVDFWNSTNDRLPPPVPSGQDFIYPTDGKFVPDYLRVFHFPQATIRDLAYDCFTFPVPVVWGADGGNCQIVAFEVASRAPCLGPPDRRVLRAPILDLGPTSRVVPLPLTSKTAERFFRAGRPLDFHDHLDGILRDVSRPLVYYRMVGPADEDVGNVFRLTRDPAQNGVLGSER